MFERRIASIYLVFQGLAALGWWVTLFVRSEARRPFLPEGYPEEVLTACLFPDLPLYVGASIAAGIGIARQCRWFRTVLLCHVGASVYATLYCLSLSVLTGQAWLSVALMFPASIISSVIAWRFR